ncbi:MAG TPA: AAA family ATPase, partial [Bryobacterales bacterium]|nr:AAA family ATPase [Bryobacterales bacterium]
FDTLRVLVENCGRLVSKDELMKAVWPDAVVEEGNLAHNLTVLRKALGGKEAGQQYVQTVPGQGYRFIADVTLAVEPADEGAPARKGAPDQPTTSWEQRLEAARAALASQCIVAPAERRFTGHVVGRTKELAELFSGLQIACSGQGLVLCIAGEPGIGKSTLVERFFAEGRLRGLNCAIAMGRCSESLAASEAYLPIFEALESLLAGGCEHEMAEMMKLVAPTWYVQVAPLWASADPSFSTVAADAKTASRERMKRELAAFFEEIARVQPLILFLDDLHWADASTADLLAYLSQRLAAVRLLVIVAYRPSEMILARHPFIAVRQELQRRNLCREVHTGLLNHDDVASYLSLEFSDQRLDADLAGFIYRRTEGNPLFMTDLVRHLRQRGTLERSLDLLERDLPESVRSMIQCRIDRLGEDELELLAAASVQGQEFDSRVIADVLRLDAAVVEEQLQRLERVHAFVRRLHEKEFPDSTLSLSYAFAHVLYQHAIEEALTPSRKAALSKAAAEALLARYRTSPSSVASRLAMLFEAGRDYERAADFFIAAAANATRLYANEEAVSLSRKAITNAQKLDGSACHSRVLEASSQLGQLQLVLSRFEDAAADFETAERAAQALGDVEARANAICARALTQFYQRRMETTRETASHALAIAQAARSGLATASAEVVLGLERMCFGATDEAEERFGRSAPVLMEHGSPPHALEAVTFSGLLQAWQLNYESAHRTLDWTLQRSRDLALPYHIVMNLFVRGMALFNQGRLSEGLQDLEEGMRLAEKNRERFWLSRYPNTFGWVHRELQDFESALRFDTEGAHMARENGYGKPEANSHVNLAQDYIAIGEPHLALEHLRRAEDIFEADVWFRWRYNIRTKAELARYWLLRGDTRQAQRCALESVALAEPRKARKHLAWGHKILGDVAAAEERFADAQSEYETALRLLERYRCPLIEWRVLLAAAEMASAYRDVSLAEHYRGRCRHVIHVLADSLIEERLRRQFLGSEAIRRALSM